MLSIYKGRCWDPEKLNNSSKATQLAYPFIDIICWVFLICQAPWEKIGRIKINECIYRSFLRVTIWSGVGGRQGTGNRRQMWKRMGMVEWYRGGHRPHIEENNSRTKTRLRETDVKFCCRDHPNPGIEPRCLALQEDSLPSEPPGRGKALRTANTKVCNANDASVHMEWRAGTEAGVWEG